MKNFPPSLALILGLLLPILPASAVPTTIMPLGDSITKGAVDPAPSLSGYRARLFLRLRSAALPFRFVGCTDKNSNPAMIAAGQQWHNGYGSYRIDELRANLDGTQPCPRGDDNHGGYWLTGGHGTGRPAVEPDLVLLMAGTNDAGQNNPPAALCSRMAALLDWFVANRPRTKVIVAQAVPFDDAMKKTQGRNDRILALNKWLRDHIPSRYPKYMLIDLYAPFIDAKGQLKQANSPDGIFLADGVHPSHNGYVAMGDIWFEAVRKALSDPLLHFAH